MSKQTDDLFDDEVTTGATLDSGTTIGGNTAFHLGNDGQGSGLDAETVDGQEPVTKGQKYVESDEFSSTNEGSVLEKYDTPDSNPEGLDETSDECIWLTADSTFYKSDRQISSVIERFSSPCYDTYGLAVDRNNCIWISNDRVEQIVRYDRNGNNEAEFTTPDGGPRDMSFDENDCLWYSDTNASCIYQFDKSINTITQFSAPSTAPNSAAVDVEQSIWVSDGSALSLFKVDQSGAIKSGFSAPDSSPFGAFVDKNNCIWHSDTFGAQCVYKIDSGKEFLGKKLEKL